MMFKRNSQNGNFLPDKRDSEVLAKNDKSILEKTHIKKCQYLNIHRQNLINFNNELTIPSPGEIIKIRTQKQHNAFTYILALKEKYKTIDSLTILTFNINEKTLYVLDDWLKNGTLKKLCLCVSESISFRMPKRYEYIINNFKGKADIIFAWNHAKIALIKCQDNYYVVEGSGNYSDNAEIEQYIFENSKESYDFDMQNLVNNIFTSKKVKII